MKIWKIIENALWILLILVTIDFIGFLAWGMSGQRPADGFFIGTVSYHVARELQ